MPKNNSNKYYKIYSRKLMYDYIIVGAGPCGITLAQLLSKHNKVILLERNPTVGGCHRVTRVNNYFSEHGPRVYSTAFKTFRAVLADAGVDFEQIFTPYKFTSSETAKYIMSQLTVSELLHLSIAFIESICIQNNTNINEWMEQHNFESRDLINRLCRMTDGSPEFSLHKFLQLLNQNIFYQFMQPKAPTDMLLFPLWTKDLNIKTNCNVTAVTPHSVVCNNQVYLGKKIILAIPPSAIAKLLPGYPDPPETRYNPYVSVTYLTPKVESKWNPPVGDWGVISIVLSDYFGGNTLISAAASILDRKSSYTLKTAHESSREELVEEIFRQLPYETYYSAVVSPGVYRAGDKWANTDTAYVATAGAKSLPQIYAGVYTCGTHNGRQKYAFTTIESAVSNAVELARELDPKVTLTVKTPVELTGCIRVILVLIIICMYYFYIK